jgi:hypothetical protein
VLNVLGTLSSILTTARNWGYNCDQIDVEKLKLPLRGARRGTSLSINSEEFSRSLRSLGEHCTVF